MSLLPVIFHPDAMEEADTAVDWYAERSIRATQRFLMDFEGTLSAMAEAPHRWPPFAGTHRRILFRQFPYLPIYRTFNDRIEVLAVAHGGRRPGYWRKRMNQ